MLQDAGHNASPDIVRSPGVVTADAMSTATRARRAKRILRHGSPLLPVWVSLEGELRQIELAFVSRTQREKAPGWSTEVALIKLVYYHELAIHERAIFRMSQS